jgi:molybdopterin/thiamine biosynthesis adenylyltransferase
MSSNDDLVLLNVTIVEANENSLYGLLLTCCVPFISLFFQSPFEFSKNRHITMNSCSYTADRMRQQGNISLLMCLAINVTLLLQIIDSPAAWSFPLSQPGLLHPQRIFQPQSTRPFHPTCYAISSSRTSLSNDEISRYSRHLVLSDVGMQGQETLKNSSVLVIGAGGLGSPCLMYLAAAGVGHVGIVDADTVDASNLQRQIIHGTSTVGVSKCKSARGRIEDINPHVRIRLYEEEFTSENALRILQGGFEDGRPYDVVIDGSDNFPTKYLINDACHIVGVSWVYSAILAFEGQLSVFNYENGPTYRDMLPLPPPPGEVPSCAEGGVLGVLPG